VLLGWGGRGGGDFLLKVTCIEYDRRTLNLEEKVCMTSFKSTNRLIQSMGKQTYFDTQIMFYVNGFVKIFNSFDVIVHKLTAICIGKIKRESIPFSSKTKQKIFKI
jgi:hypothetical protein